MGSRKAEPGWKRVPSGMSCWYRLEYPDDSSVVCIPAQPTGEMYYQHSWPGRRRDWLTRSPVSIDQVTRSFIVFFNREWQPRIEISPFIDQGSLYWAGSRAPGAEVTLPLRGILPGNMGWAGLLALFAADAGTGPPRAEEAEVGRDGEEQAERADPTADRP